MPPISTKEEFRKWLRINHKKETKVCILLHKKHTGKPAPTHREQIEEAICYGWIDTTVKRNDEDTYIRCFSKRTVNSRWSDNTISYGKQLIKEGRMKPEGLKYYKLGIAKPTHDHGIPKNPTMPIEFKNILSKNKKAMNNFESFPPSTKKMLYRWVIRGKLPATREKRVKCIFDGAMENNRDIIMQTN